VVEFREVSAVRTQHVCMCAEQWGGGVVEFRELEDVDLPNLCHVEAGSKPADVASPNHGDGSIARPKQPAVSACSDVDADAGISSLLTPAQEAHRQQLYAQTDRFTHGWLAAGRRVSAGRRAGRAMLAEAGVATSTAAAEAEERRAAETGSAKAAAAEGGTGAVNVIVSSGQLIPTLVKCLLFSLDPFICSTNIHSSRREGKLVCFKRIRDRFSDRHSNRHSGAVTSTVTSTLEGIAADAVCCKTSQTVRSGEHRFVAVGDGCEEAAAARIMGWPYVRVDAAWEDMRLTSMSLAQILQARAG
ncbi:unnamed protein product, partial [Closterium sp. NIES-65]